MNVTLRQLEYIVAVAARRSFTEAARLCCVSQPALSAQVTQLETSLQAQLFERTARGVTLTPFGTEFVARAEKVLAGIEELERLASKEKQPLAGDLRLGVIPTLAPYLVPTIVRDLRARHPQCRLLLAEDLTDRLVRRVEAGDLDVLVLALETDLGRCTVRPWFRDEFVAAVPAEHPLAQAASVSIEELLAENLLLLEEGHCLSSQVRAACGGPAGELGDFRAGSLGTLVQMVALGIGVTLIPEIAREALAKATPGIVLRPLAKVAFRQVGFAWRKNHPREAEFEIFAESVGAPDGKKTRGCS